MKRAGDPDDPRSAALYREVPGTILERFQAFRRDFPYRELTIDGVRWSYLAGERNGPPLLIFPGALVVPDISWETVVGLAPRHRVIVPAYPPVGTMAELVDGTARILKHEGIERADVLGGSYGGFVSQVFVRRYPKAVNSLILSHTRPPYPETVRQMRRTVRLLRFLPMGIIRPMMERVFRSMMPARSDDTSCMLAIFDELIDHILEKKDIIGIMERTADYSSLAFTPGDPAGPMKILLLFGEDDPATPPEVRSRMESLYPGCSVHVFAGTGHTTSVTDREAYLNAIEEYLSRE